MGVFFVKKGGKWGVFCKKWTFSQRRVHCVQYQYFLILHFTHWGGVRTQPTHPPAYGPEPAGAVSHKPGGRLPLLSARPAITLATVKRAATSFAVW